MKCIVTRKLNVRPLRPVLNRDLKSVQNAPYRTLRMGDYPMERKIGRSRQGCKVDCHRTARDNAQRDISQDITNIIFGGTCSTHMDNVKCIQHFECKYETEGSV